MGSENIVKLSCILTNPRINQKPGFVGDGVDGVAWSLNIFPLV